MSHTPSLKAAMSARVDPATAQRLYSNSYNIGYPENCPIPDGIELTFDIYGREVPRSTLNTRGGIDGCSNNQYFNVQRRIAVENVIERPYVPIAQAGSRWGGDPMGVARNRQPKNVYNQGGDNGGFLKTYATPNNAPTDTAKGCAIPPANGEYTGMATQRRYPHSMDAQQNRIQY